MKSITKKIKVKSQETSKNYRLLDANDLHCITTEVNSTVDFWTNKSIHSREKTQEGKGKREVI